MKYDIGQSFESAIATAFKTMRNERAYGFLSNYLVDLGYNYADTVAILTERGYTVDRPLLRLTFAPIITGADNIRYVSGLDLDTLPEERYFDVKMWTNPERYRYQIQGVTYDAVGNEVREGATYTYTNDIYTKGEIQKLQAAAVEKKKSMNVWTGPEGVKWWDVLKIEEQGIPEYLV